MLELGTLLFITLLWSGNMTSSAFQIYNKKQLYLHVCYAHCMCVILAQMQISRCGNLRIICINITFGTRPSFCFCYLYRRETSL